MSVTPAEACPKCSFALVATSSAAWCGSPHVGDFTICPSCGAVLQFGKGMLVHGFAGNEWRDQLLHQPDAILKILDHQCTVRGGAPQAAKPRRK